MLVKEGLAKLALAGLLLARGRVGSGGYGKVVFLGLVLWVGEGVLMNVFAEVASTSTGSVGEDTQGDSGGFLFLF